MSDIDHDKPGNPSADEGPSGPVGFDPTPYLRSLRGRGGNEEYLNVKHRLLWLRRDHPDAEIVTEHIRIDDKSAIFRARVSIPGGGSATGHGSETAQDFADFIEKAETKALGRALNALGYGAQFAEGEDDPIARPTTSNAPAATAKPFPANAPMVAPASPPTVATQPPADLSPEQQEPALEDYSWTAFWRWARGEGMHSKDEIERRIGRDMIGLTPGQVRMLLLNARHGSDTPS